MVINVVTVFSRPITAAATAIPDPVALITKYPSGMLASKITATAEIDKLLGTATPPADFRLGAAVFWVRVKASQP